VRSAMPPSFDPVVPGGNLTPRAGPHHR
jgi:hypothetical protein